MRPRPRPRAGFEPNPATGGTHVPPVAACAVVRPIHFWGPPSHYRITCVVVPYFGVWGSAPTHADVACVGSCRTHPHLGPGVGVARSAPGRYVSSPTLTAPGGARHFVGQGHRHHFRRLGRHHPLQPGRGPHAASDALSETPPWRLAPARHADIPLSHFGNGTGAVRPCCGLECWATREVS